MFMSHFLALDIGLARTGVAFGDDEQDFIVALDTLHHSTLDELATQVSRLVCEKKIDRMVVGLPRLPSGEEGEQAGIVRAAAKVIRSKTGLSVDFIDERYTTKTPLSGLKSDPDAESACQILSVYLAQKKRRNGIDI